MSEFKIEVGKLYRTRDGRRAAVTAPTRSCEKYHFIGKLDGELYGLSWDEFGRFYGENMVDSNLDLIAPWEETPATLCAADVSSAFNAQAEIMGTPINPSGVSDGIGDLIKTRAETHGDFCTNSVVSQNLKGILRREPGWERLKFTQQEALDHICGKLGRIMAGDPDHADHWIDIAGYAQLAAMEGGE